MVSMGKRLRLARALARPSLRMHFHVTSLFECQTRFVLQHVSEGAGRWSLGSEVH